MKTKVENLFIEILGIKHLKPLDPFSAFVRIGDQGARIYLYYLGCEEQLQIRRAAGRQSVERLVDWVAYGSYLFLQIYGQNNKFWGQWKDTLEVLLINIKDEDYLARIFYSNLKWTYRFAEGIDWSASHYAYNGEQYLSTIESKKTHVLAMQAQVQFLTPPAGYSPRRMTRLTVNLEGSKANQRHLGNYQELFDEDIE